MDGSGAVGGGPLMYPQSRIEPSGRLALAELLSSRQA